MSRSTKLLIGLVAAVSISGCASVKPVQMTAASAGSMKNMRISTSQREVPSFAAQTAAKAMLGIFGAMAMIADGNAIVRENGVEDPARHMASQLTLDLSNRFEAKATGRAASVVDDDVKKLTLDGVGAEFLVDVATVNWGFLYYAGTFDTYGIIYSSRFRLIDVKNGNVLAEAYCARRPAQVPDSPSYDQLVANKAERLKRDLKTVADQCVEEFKSSVLKI